MNEAYIRRNIYQMLRYRYDLWPDHFPDIPGNKQPGRPDLVVMNPKGPGFYVEVKALNLKQKTSFSFSDITDGQRQWLSIWEEERPEGSWLAIGVHSTRHEIYLVPWPFWLRVETAVRRYQDSLPYRVGPGYLTEMQQQELDFHLIEQFRLLRVPVKERLPKESGWRIPQEAPWLT